MHPLFEKDIIVRGAREHNLRSVDLTLPHGSLICFSGVSGSGKSSLAFDTLYAEGQRRYLESLSSYARQYIGQLPKPNVDFISGLSPSISISQKSTGSNPRSTVGTITEVYDFLRVLYARVGTGYCPNCNVPIAAQTRDQILAKIASLPANQTFAILAPLIRRQKGEYRDLFDDLRKQGFGRVRVNGSIYTLAEVPSLERQMRHSIEVVVDRIQVGTTSRQRLSEAIDVATRLGAGSLIVAPLDAESPPRSKPKDVAHKETIEGDIDFSCNFSCPRCGSSFTPPSPQLLSFNSPQGMCTLCRGLGHLYTFDPELLIPDTSKSIRSGAIALLGKWTKMSRWIRRQIEGVAYTLERDEKIPMGSLLITPWIELPQQVKDWWLYGTGERHITYTWRGGSKPLRFGGKFEGLIPQFLQQWNSSRNPMYRRLLEKYMHTLDCASCHGQRLNPQARSIRLKTCNPKFSKNALMSLPEVCELPLRDCLDFFASLELTEKQIQIAGQALKEIHSRLGFLLDVGLNYLTLSRPSPSLSGGEMQRIRLASQIGAGLVGVLYVLDEPSIGLHPRDNDRLLKSLQHLRDLGNTLIVVEHDEDTMRAADMIVDFGPGPGVRGGHIVAKGTLDAICKSKESVTGGYLSGRKAIVHPEHRRTGTGKKLTIVGARQNNLRNIRVEFPLGCFICVTGVSGSGKSSLVTEILTPVLRNKLNGAESEVGKHDRINGVDHLDKIIDIDQSPIGRTPRSNPATYVKVFDEIRDLFAKLPESRARGFRPGRFSFNTAEGRCSACDGNGANKLEMEFLADLWVTCPVCNGSRYGRETLAVKFKDKTIAECLDLDVQQALDLFSELPKIADKLQTLHDVGLDYLKLGQPSPTLSGGEAQRIKLAKELCRRSTGRTLYVLDEPTTGLHFADIALLLQVLQSLVDLGNTVVVIEHNLDVVQAADWVIDLGPEGGSEGGQVIATGTPEQIAKTKQSYTGISLSKHLQQQIDLQKKSTAAKSTTAKTRSAKKTTHLSVEGACQHNLQHVNLKVPLGEMTVFCGPSGSGKTSLAMDTIYAEGQRRYVESLSAYARQFIGQMPKPIVERIEGLSPAVALEQKNLGHSPRSTVGTVTEIYDYLRLLMARLGKMHCTQCDAPVETQTIDQIAENIEQMPKGSRILLLAPLVFERTENIKARFDDLRRQGFVRVRIDGVSYPLDQLPTMQRTTQYQIQVVVDRLQINAKDRSRIADSVATAIDLGRGVVQVALADDSRPEPMWELNTHSLYLACHRCGLSFQSVTPHSFSFNSSLGWCPSCQGLGTQLGTNPAALMDMSKSLADGGMLLWPNLDGPLAKAMLNAFCTATGIPGDIGLGQLSMSQRYLLLNGTGDRWYEIPSNKGQLRFQYRGIYPAIDAAAKQSPSLRQRLDRFVAEVECMTCQGARVRREAAMTRFRDLTIGELVGMPLQSLLDTVQLWKLDKREQTIAGEILHEVHNRLQFLIDVGLEYLSLGRNASTLSGGESQRIRLASQLGSGLCGVLYVLDEPTIGLHPRDNQRLIGALHRLRDLGNTLVVVEHDRDVIASSNEICDFGPGAGRLGGHVVAQGSPEKVARQKKSVTGPFIAGTKAIPAPLHRRMTSAKSGSDELVPPAGAWLTVLGAREHTLRDIDVAFPLGCFIAVTGPSGSGKSSLINDVLYPALARKLHRAQIAEGTYRSIDGLSNVDKVVQVDQSALGNSPASNPATYSGAFDLIRQLFAQLPDARIRGFTARQFSFNVPGGRCEKCEGNGQIRVEMHFLADVWVECDACHGKRYTEETLAVRFKGKSIVDVLRMPIGEARDLLVNFPKIHKILQTLCDVGLDYVALGQSAPTLSGGEAQRVKLAAELARPNTGRTLYLLDEPTTGLHFEDIIKLLEVLNRLVDVGNTVVVIEHNLDVIKTADWVIDLGPEAGWNGGQVVVAGTPEQIVAKCGTFSIKPSRKKSSTQLLSNVENNTQLRSYTAEALKPVLESSPRAKRTPYDPLAETVTKPEDLSLQDVGRQSQAPWESDGRKWHLESSLDRKGKPVHWDRKILAEIIERIENFGRFAPVNWASRSIVEVTGPVKNQGWFMHAITAETWLLKIKIRIPKGYIKKVEFEETIDLPTLNEMDEVQAYGNDSRVRVRTGSEWQEIELRLYRFAEVNKPAFWKLFRRCMDAFTENVRLEHSPETIEPQPSKRKPTRNSTDNPGTVDKYWHCSDKGFADVTKRKWQTNLTDEVVKQLDQVAPKGTWDWSSPEQVTFTSAEKVQAVLRTKQVDSLELSFDLLTGQLLKEALKGFGRRSTMVMNKDGTSGVAIKLFNKDHLSDPAFESLLKDIFALDTNRSESGSSPNNPPEKTKQRAPRRKASTV